MYIVVWDDSFLLMTIAIVLSETNAKECEVVA